MVLCFDTVYCETEHLIVVIDVGLCITGLYLMKMSNKSEIFCWLGAEDVSISTDNNVGETPCPTGDAEDADSGTQTPNSQLSEPAEIYDEEAATSAVHISPGTPRTAEAENGDSQITVAVTDSHNGIVHWYCLMWNYFIVVFSFGLTVLLFSI